MQSTVNPAVDAARAEAADGPVPAPGGALSYIHGGRILAGALVAVAVSFVLMTFASVVGLALGSPSPTWRDTSRGLTLLSGVWILLVAIGSFALGGYVAGRLRSTWATTADEVEFRDGTHGLLVWALAVVLAALLTWAATTALSTASTANNNAQRSAASEPSFLAFELDRLFRSERRPDTLDPEARTEAGRIIASGLGRREIATEDRNYLVRLVSARTGLSAADADGRVGQVVAEARRANRRARTSAIVIGYM